jgi:hypothetical protein
MIENRVAIPWQSKPQLSPSATTSTMSGERRLWSAVLGQAIEDLKDTRTPPGFVHAARLWFASDDYGPASFRWICDQLEFDAPMIRRRLIDMSQATQHLVHS